VADGHLRADERGTVGERYLLGGRNFTFDRLFADLSRLSGVEPPVKVPTAVATVAVTALELAPGRSPLSPQEVAAASQWWTYRSNRARRELGWKARPHEETLQATVDWYMEHDHDRIARSRRSQGLPYRAAGIALGVAEGIGTLWRRRGP
jgi:dihydroflavonol-4-reductase